MLNKVGFVPVQAQKVSFGEKKESNLVENMVESLCEAEVDPYKAASFLRNSAEHFHGKGKLDADEFAKQMKISATNIEDSPLRFYF